MFVLKSSFDTLQQQHQALTAEHNHLQQEFQALQREFDELSSTQQTVTTEQDSFTESLAVHLVECINQVQSVRESVLSAYQAIEHEQQSSGEIHDKLESSSNALEVIVNDMGALSSEMGNMSTQISGLSAS